MLKKITELNESVIKNILEETLKTSDKRNFVQTMDVGVNLFGINFKQPQNRINVSVILPVPFKKSPKTLLFAKDKNYISQMKDIFTKIINADDIPSLDKKEVKKMAIEYDLFFAEPSVMAIVGKYLGQVLAPRGKMPKPAPPNVNAIKIIIDKELKTIVISNKKGKYMPVVHFAIGKENMSVEDLTKNFMACYNAILNVLPANTQNIKSMYVKTTMGKINFIYKK